MPDEPSAPLPTPTHYQRTAGGHLAWQPPTPEHLQEMLPTYEVMSILGQGGMGAVYKGRQKSLDRIVAIKILPPEAAEDDMQFAERFKNEARTMAKMNHPAIVHVYDFGETSEGQLYIVMEFIDGTDVAKMIQSQGKLPEDYALSITAHVCDALGYAHEQGVVHRDIKPANVLINMQGQVKVADFGLAKATDPSQMGLTKTNMAMGTPDFVSPEALMPGVPLDGRADLYAVGVMLYNMLTGTIPRGAFRMPGVTLKTDARFDKIILKAMEMDRENRYQTALDLRRDLDVILTTPAAKSDGQTLPAQAALPQKPMGKSPGPPQGKEASAGVPSGAAQPARQPNQGGAAAKKNDAVKSAPLPPAKSNAALFTIIGIAAVLAIGAFVMFSGGKKPAEQSVGQTKVAILKPEDKPASISSTQTAPVAVKTSPASSTTTSAATQDGFTNSLSMKFLPVAGTDVLFGIHEVRYKDYAAYAAESQGADGSWKNQTVNDYAITERNEDHPVTRVSWEDAQAFCAWLSKKEGKLYRLPTDEEWSYAVGIDREEQRKQGMTPATVPQVPDAFPWGGDFPPKTQDKVGDYRDASLGAKAPRPGGNGEYMENYDDGFPTTAPVMSFKPNKLGLYDLGGNVWEWCEDWYDNAQKDRVARGGSWNNGDRDHLLSSYRGHNTPGFRFDGSRGFRCVVVPGSVSAASKPASSTPKPVPAPAAVAAGNEKWVDGLAQWFGGTQTNKAFVRESNGAARIGSGGASLKPIPSSAPVFRDQALLIRWHGTNPLAEVQLHVRNTKDASGKLTDYRADVKAAKKGGWEVFMAGPVAIGKPQALPSDFKIDATHTMEFRIVGDLLTATVDGKKIAEGRDSQLTAGHPAFSGHDVVIESFEYANLDPGGAAPALAAAKPAPASPIAAAAPLTQPVDLLALVDVKRDAVFGDWTINQEGLIQKNASGTKLLGFNQALPEEYDFEIEFTPAQGEREVIQVLPVLGGTALNWHMGLNKNDPALFAFGPVLDGKNPEDPKRSEAVVKHPRLAADHRYRSTVEVRKGSLRALLDGQEVLKWSGDFKRFSMEKNAGKLRDASQAGVGGHDSGIIFHKAEVRPVTAKGDIPAAVTPAPVSTAPAVTPTMPADAPAPAPAVPVAPADPRLAQLAAGFKARHDADALQPFNTALAALNTSYVANGIARARTAAKAKGSLAEVTALDAEKTAIEQGRGVPDADEPDTPDSLKTLRVTYRTAHAKFATERDAKAAPLYDMYLKALDAYIAELTQADKIDAARKVQVFRDDIALQKPGAAAPQANEKATPTAPASSTASKPAVRAPKMNEREVAEWAIATGGNVEVVFGIPLVTKTIAIASELPQGRFIITKVRVNCDKVPGKDLSPLASAQDVLSLYLENSLLPDQTSLDLAVLRQMPKLHSLTTKDLDAPAVEVIASLAGLDALYTRTMPEGSVEKIAKLKQLGAFGSFSITGPSIAALKSCKRLHDIRSEAAASDEDVRALAAVCPELDYLLVGGPALTNACIPFLLPLKSLGNLTLLSDELDDSVIEPLGKLPNLTTLRLSSRKIIGSNLDVLKKFDSLHDLCLDACSITDEALDVLVQIKGLTKLQLRRTKVTDAGIAKFKAARPGFDISK